MMSQSLLIGGLSPRPAAGDFGVVGGQCKGEHAPRRLPSGAGECLFGSKLVLIL